MSCSWKVAELCVNQRLNRSSHWGAGHSCGSDSIPGLGNFHMPWVWQKKINTLFKILAIILCGKKKQKNKKNTKP